MKKLTKALFGTACIASLGMGFLTFGQAYADAEGLTRIYVWDDTTQTSCDLYKSGGSSTSCGSTYGSYNATDNILTLGSGVNGKSIQMMDSSTTGNSYTIRATSDISASFSSPDYATITFDLTDYTYTSQKDIPFLLPRHGNVIWESGELVDANVFSVQDGELTINGGTITVDEGAMVGSFTLNGGTFKARSLSVDKGDIKIKGGELEMNCVDDSCVTGLSLSTIDGGQTFDLNDGVVTLNVGNDAHSHNGFSAGKNSVININGGELNINDAFTGISLGKYGSVINFNGGVTTIKNSSRYAIYSSETEDYEKTIAFDEGMGIMEPKLHIFYSKIGEVYETGVVANDTLTIAEGGTVKRVEKSEMGDDDEGDDSKIAVPDTGVFSGDANNATIVAISVAALSAVAATLYGIVYLIKRNSKHITFKK